MPPDTLVSQDPIADRRYVYGKGAADDGDFRTAADLFEQALEQAPGWPAALFALAEARERLGERDAAVAAFRGALAADPGDPFGASARLALIGATAQPDGLPRAYVTRLFDDYAPRFERHLLDALGYRAPALIVEALDAVAPGRRFASAIDLGCGSGLMGAAIRGRVGRLDGVDLAPSMVARAREIGAYDAVETADAVERLDRAPPSAFDLILAADALCYFGDLAPVFAACRGALADDGLVAFTVEAFEGAGFRLLRGLRFAHAPSHVEDAARAAGLRVARLLTASARREADVEAPGLVGVLTA
ncbi:putative TPR repeat methyltransferase [Roseiarcus fermentans]|uniref:Putative TPR repeat methyltransferase n=1 Tax=Roseiarcus fermentans TaxID=1473586 RepID=A0A366FDZ0_9HYPH|nr:methyltransferase [Roseiarcus fermentans]RBP12878.1 putative TPR repeat methyltransferase [Roseiarcus fermentans]